MTVTGKDLSAGYQMVQSMHSLAEFAHQLPMFFKSWKENSNYLISLATQDEKSLKFLYDKLQECGAPTVAFYEPDYNDEMTALCFYGLAHYRKLVSNLPLALKYGGADDKITECTVSY